MPKNKGLPITEGLGGDGGAPDVLAGGNGGEPPEEPIVPTGNFEENGYNPGEIDDPYAGMPDMSGLEKNQAYTALFNPDDDQLPMMARTPSALIPVLIRAAVRKGAAKPYLPPSFLQKLKDEGKDSYRGIPLEYFRTRTLAEIKMDARLRFPVGRDGIGREEGAAILMPESDEVSEENRLHS